MLKISGQQVIYYSSSSSLIIPATGNIVTEISDTVSSKNKIQNEKKSDQFYDSLEVKAGEKKTTKALFDLLITSETQQKTINNYEVTSETPFLKYNNAIIKSIRFRQLDVFGPTVSDTVRKATTWLEKTGNKLHFKTNEKILRNNLLVKTGEPLNAIVLSDNERIIRDLPYIEDVRFLIIPNTPNADTIDIVVVVKERWAIGFGMEISSVYSGEFNLWHKNIFGWGNENQYNVFWNTKNTPLLGYEGIYKVNNIAGSFVSSSCRYQKKYETEYYKIEFQRKFFTPNIKYAGGLTIESNDTRINIELLDTILEDKPVHYNRCNFWVGRSFNIQNKRNLLTNSRTNLMFTGGLNRIIFSERPTTSPDRLYKYHDRYTFLGSAGISRQGYFKSHLIYGFNHTEDIPFGILLEFIAGVELSEYFQRPYLGTSLSHGTYLWRYGYLYNRLDMGGFYYKDKFEQNVVSLTTKYFTHLISKDRFKYRFFANINYKIGINRFEDEFISIENNQGIHGLKNSSRLKGTEKLTVNLEADAFTPYFIYGFRFVIFGFTDFALVGMSNNNIFSNKLFSGLGVGIRLRNERLVFNTFQIKLAYYPTAPDEADKEYFSVSGERKLRPEYFFISAPEIIDF